jgi:hypothetical protein
MNKGIEQILKLAKTRVELSNHFSTIKQSIILDAIQNNEIEQLTNELKRPLNMIEQGMVLDYQMQWELVKGNLNEREEKKSEILVELNSIKNNIEKELLVEKNNIPIELRAQIDRLGDKPYSTKKEEISEPSINFDESILNEDIAPVLDQNTGEILNFEILEKISNLNFNIPVTYFTELLKERQYQIIEDIIERKLDVDELVELHNIRKLLPA